MPSVRATRKVAPGHGSEDWGDLPCRSHAGHGHLTGGRGPCRRGDSSRRCPHVRPAAKGGRLASSSSALQLQGLARFAGGGGETVSLLPSPQDPPLLLDHVGAAGALRRPPPPPP